MALVPSPDSFSSHRRPLAACFSTIFALSAPAAAIAANTWAVTSCLDDGSAGTLRAVIGAGGTTLSGDTVDLSGLSCPGSTITLASGGSHITVAQDSLTIKGPPGPTALTIDGSALDSYIVNLSNVFYHTGTGTLTIESLAVKGGHQSHRYANGLGGCIYSNANVTLSGVYLSSCSAHSEFYAARGGSIYAKGDVTVTNSLVVGNSATAVGGAIGGGIYAQGKVSFLGSLVAGNSAIVNGVGAANGGGVYAKGNAEFVASTVTGNSTSTNGNTAGGGILAGAKLNLEHSVVSGNSANSQAGKAIGGGANAAGNFYSQYSTINGNQIWAPNIAAVAGGLYLGGSAMITNSTISGNSTSGRFAGIVALSFTPTLNSFFMRNSTISGNSAANVGGALYVNSSSTGFYNSTIAFNTASDVPGTVLGGYLGPMNVTLQNTLMSNNTYGASENDLSAIDGPGGPDILFNAGPAHNLIRVTGLPGLPSDTVFNTCPLLGSLRDNGGLTKTHALMSTSVAINAGPTALPIDYDQRGSASANGTADYPRISGPIGDPSPKADIGAYEVQQNEIVFTSNFEGCP